MAGLCLGCNGRVIANHEYEILTCPYDYRYHHMHQGKPSSPVSGDAAYPCEACDLELGRILDGELLSVRFRPIASLHACGVVGHIGTVSGPQDALLHSTARLFAAAARLAQMPRLVRMMARAVFGRYAGNDGIGQLFLPLPSPAVTVLGEALAGLLDEARMESALPAAAIVIVTPCLGWQADDDALQRLATVVNACTRLGMGVASGAFGCARSEHQIWRDRGPRYLLLDEAQFDGVDAVLVAGGSLATELSAMTARGCRVVAQGIAGRHDLRVAERLGIDLVAGDYIGRNNVSPTPILAAAAYKAIRLSRTYGGAASTVESVRLLQRLKLDVAPVRRDTPAEDVFTIFERNPQLRAVAVVDDGVPVGLISRYEMIDNMARPYRHELYGRKSCIRFMDREPIMVDVQLSLPELTDIFVRADPRHLVSGFIVTDGGRYVGMGSVQDLMREITAMQIEAARYSDPLTQLAGSVPINQHVDKLLAEGESFVICFCDLDHFKPFNDVYGYAKGDRVIALAARILGECSEPDVDIVGHVGGDDFILVMKSRDWEARCELALRLFAEEILGFFSHDDIERGGYVTENRRGGLEFHPLTSLSIGAVVVAQRQFANHLQVAGVASEVKKKAKAIAGNSLYVNRRRYVAEGETRAEAAPDSGGDGPAVRGDRY